MTMCESPKVLKGEKMKKKGFTLVELLVVIAIIALLMGILMPALAKVRQIAQRMVCGSNLSGIGKAMLIYANDYEDEFPRAGGVTSVWNGPVIWDAIDRSTAYGVNATTGAGGKATISSCFYLLIKYAEVTSKSFICKGDSGAVEFKLTDYPQHRADLVEMVQAWEFGPPPTVGDPRKHCSYTYHIPFGTPYALTTSSEPGMAVAADRNPWIPAPGADARTPFTDFVPDIPPTFTGTAITAKKGNAQTHQDDGQNVLFMDTHVDFASRPYVGIEDDNIYTYMPPGGIGYPQKGLQPMAFQATTIPGKKTDSLLVHDGQYTKGPRCFPADTLVWVDGSVVQISQVAQGQKISTLEPIERVEEHEGTFDCYDVVLETGDCISVAGSHLFLLDSQRWVPVQYLKAGFKLMSLKGPVGISSVSKRATPLVGKVYNLKIKDSERYCVGRDGLIVRDW
jgi:prepilin-type N-terminal cleavage/methylation domain-containing protein